MNASDFGLGGALTLVTRESLTPLFEAMAEAAGPKTGAKREKYFNLSKFFKTRREAANAAAALETLGHHIITGKCGGKDIKVRCLVGQHQPC